MATMDLPLPEVTVENFDRAWMQFGLVAKAIIWGDNKQLAILPTLLRGKLIDYFMELRDEDKTDLPTLKAALSKRAGLTKDSLESARLFEDQNQGHTEKVSDYSSGLMRLFRQAYPDVDKKSPILLQCFVMGLQPITRQQLLLKGKPADLDTAIENAKQIAYALNFQKQESEVNAVQIREIESIGDDNAEGRTTHIYLQAKVWSRRN